MKKLLLLILLTMGNSNAIAFPMVDIYTHLDITSFNSSLRPRLVNEKTLPELKGLPQPIINHDSIVIDDSDWLYTIKVIKQNEDDHEICFIDQSKVSSYSSQKPMIIRKYGSYYVAINASSNACDKYKH